MLENISQNKAHGGWHKRYSHYSSSLNCTMRFAVFLPPGASSSNPVPVLYWLSGLTCTDENFMQKAGAFRIAAQLGIAIVAPDTSPRGEDVADSEEYYLGQGAGYYVNATQEPWSHHYRMYDYVTKELPALIEDNFPVTKEKSVSGHSMGGHGALVVGLRNSDSYRSVSAFSPVSNPVKSQWGQEAFTAYLGSEPGLWKESDASELLKKKRAEVPVLVDQGEADEFISEQLMPEVLVSAAKVHDSDVRVRIHPGYDHSYYFVSSFIEEHLRFHAEYLYAG